MRIALRWLGYGLGAILILVLLAVAWVWFASSRAISAPYEAHTERLAQPTPAQLADGERQARTLGCFSCHGEGLRGNKMFDEPKVGVIWAPNLTRIAARASDQQLARAIRQGIGADGRALFIMPSGVYQHLSDQEVAALIAAVRKLPKAGSDTPDNVYGPIGRLGIVLGKFNPAPKQVEKFAALEPRRVGPEFDAGHRLAVLKCSGCHGADLTGNEVKPGELAPDLAIAGAYDLAAFTKLLRTGVPASGQKLGLMGTVARQDFSHLNDEEIAALHAYLQARAEK